MKCQKCESPNVVKNGKQGELQRFKCKDCGAQFTEATAAPKEVKPAQATTLSQVTTKLEELFDLCNEHYFEGKLPRPIITIQSSPKFYGHCTNKKVWKAEDEAWYEINMGAEFLTRPKENIAATLIHEMVHLYCRENDIKETCQNGRYHNNLFKVEAEARGLTIGYDSTIGHSPTTPQDSLIQFLNESGYTLEIPFARDLRVKKVATRKPQYTYTCPECGQTVKSSLELNLVCGDCKVPLGKGE